MIKSVDEIDTTKFLEAKTILLLDGWDGLSFVDPEKQVYHKLKSYYPKVKLFKFKGYNVYYFQQKESETP